MLTVTLATTLVGLATVGSWRLRALARDIATLRREVDTAITARADAHLNQFWDELSRLHQEHTAAVEARVQRTEATAAHAAVGQHQLDQRIDTIEQWVRVWTTAARDRR